MLTEETVQALRSALDEWEGAKGWLDNYAHENATGEYSEKEKRARQRVLRAASALTKGEAA